MKNCEIRIWGNKDRFQELPVGRAASELLTHKDMERLGFKRFQSWKTSVFYSVFFGRNSYMLCCHFPVSREIQNVDKEYRVVTLAIIIRRGYRMEYALECLKKIHFSLSDFFIKNKLLCTQPLSSALTTKIEAWENDIVNNIAKDEDQLLVNREANENRGYVSYDTEKQLADFFSEPLRIDFKGACQMLFLHNKVIPNVLPALKVQNFIEVHAVPKPQKKFALYFPDYNPQQPIQLISSLDEGFSRTFNRQGYKPITLSGKLSEHTKDWKITESNDKTSYCIGLMFKPNNKGKSTLMYGIYAVVFFM